MKRPEQQLHFACADFLRAALPRVVFWHHPAGGFRTRAEAGIFKRLGMAPGVPDLIFILPQGGLGMIELKALKGKLSQSQLDFKDAAEAWGAQWAQARSVEELETTLRAWFPREPFRATVLGSATTAPKSSKGPAANG